MKKIIKSILWLLFIGIIIIQFFPAKKNKSTGVSANDITTKYTIPDSVLAILKASCYDCHSNNTSYPWYSNIQPIGWWLDEHIQDGKKDLNFSEFTAYKIRRQYVKLKQICDLIKNDEMPLPSYLWIHKDAKLDSTQKILLINWAMQSRKEIEAAYPADSLIKK